MECDRIVVVACINGPRHTGVGPVCTDDHVHLQGVGITLERAVGVVGVVEGVGISIIVGDVELVDGPVDQLGTEFVGASAQEAI